MQELRQRQVIKRRLYSTLSLIFFTIITLLLIRGTYVVVLKELESSSKMKALNASKQSLVSRQAELKNSIQSIQTDSGIEKEIKEKFNVSKSGEHVVVIVDPKTIASSSMPISTPWYKKLWDSIMGD